jgi:hypothetical protein
MRHARLAASLALALALASAHDTLAQTGAPVSRTLGAPFERTWLVAESVLKSLGWEVDTKDATVGWIVTDSRGVEFKDFGVYGEGTRHRLRLTLRRAGDGRTIVTVERELWKEERILWMKDRKPIQPADRAVETAVLDAIERSL